MRWAGAFLSVALLAACAGGGHWTKPGADAAATAATYAACRGAAHGALATDRAIDQDIMASRGADWQRARTFSTQGEEMREEARGHLDAVIASCMRAKGFAKQG